MKDSVKEKITGVFLVIFQTLVLVGITLFAVIPFSCKVTTEGIEIIGGDYSAPAIESVNVIDENTVTMSFSESVTVRNVIVSPFIPGVSDSLSHSDSSELSPSLAAASGQYGMLNTVVTESEDKKSVTFTFDEKTAIGKSYEVFGTVEDEIGNTLTFCVPFTGFNSSVPKMIMTEVQIKYQKATSKGNTIYRGEYVEFLALEAGNLAGLELISASDGEEKKYVFPAIDVKQGEIFIVHFRTIGEGCVNELGEDLNSATAPHSKDGVRDFWSESTVAHFNDSSDIILLKNTVDGSIMDGLMYAAPEAAEWKSSVAATAVEISDAGLYGSSDISNASSSKGCTTLKALTRVDALSILELAMEKEEFEYPVPVDENSWIVEPASPGVL